MSDLKIIELTNFETPSLENYDDFRTMDLWATRSMSQYHQEYLDNHQDIKEVFFCDGKRVLARTSFHENENEINLFGRQIELSHDPSLNAQEENQLFRFFASWLRTRFEGKKVKIKSNAFILKHFFDDVETYREIKNARLDLSLNEDIILQSIRKSYRSLINWGKKSLEIIHLTSKQNSPELFESFKQLHIAAAGRQTRNDESWKAQYQQIQNNEAFLTLAKLDGKLVSGVFILVDSQKAFYAVAASDRTLMEQNLALNHWPLLSSILWAKSIGHQYFEFGDITPDKDDKKLSDINKFKRGFCTEVLIENVLTLSL